MQDQSKKIKIGDNLVMFEKDQDFQIIISIFGPTLKDGYISTRKFGQAQLKNMIKYDAMITPFPLKSGDCACFQYGVFCYPEQGIAINLRRDDVLEFLATNA